MPETFELPQGLTAADMDRNIAAMLRDESDAALRRQDLARMDHSGAAYQKFTRKPQPEKNNARPA